MKAVPPAAADQSGFCWSTIALLTSVDGCMLIDTRPAFRRAPLAQTLKSHGLAFDDIDTVILTHLHWDHCQNADLFENARILVHPRELDYARKPELRRRQRRLANRRHDGQDEGRADI